MIDIGINFLHENIKSYNILKKYHIINTLKYPGRICTYEALEEFLLFTKNNNFKIDLHGIPGMKPSFSCENNIVIGNIDFNHLNETFLINNDIHRISTHVGMGINEKLSDFTEKQLEYNWKQNYDSLRYKLGNIFGRNIDIGLENIPGLFPYDLQTLTPQFVSKNWEKADFGVFDISHARLACEALKMKYDEYLDQLDNTEKVKILHSTGNIRTTEKNKHIIDKHVLITANEIEYLIKTLNKFTNLDLVVSEFTDDTNFSGVKETIIEAVVLHYAVKTKNEEKCKYILKFIEDNLKNDISNAEEILEEIKKY